MARIYHNRSRFGGSPHVFIATISYTGRPCAAYVSSLASTMAALYQEGIAADYYMQTGNCHVDDARNGALRDFLQTACTHLVFIDDDVGWNAADFSKLCRYDADIVAGVYPKRTPDDSGDEYPVHFEPGVELQARPDGLLEVPAAPTGFMCIARHVIEKMVSLNAHRKYVGQHDKSGVPYTIVFERTYQDGHRWSGDYSFCRTWRAMGGTVFADPEMRFVHAGEKEWAGCLGDHLRERSGIYHPALIEGVAAIKEGRSSPETLAAMSLAWGNDKYAATLELLSAFTSLLGGNSGPVLETGSGLTTLLAGIMADRAGFPVITLEHDLTWFNKMRAALSAFGIHNVDLRYAPLQEYEHGKFWYQIQDDLPASFSACLCDGPLLRFGRGSLYSILGDRLVSASIIMDDAFSEPSMLALKEWAASHGRAVHVLGSARKFAVCPTLAGE